MALPATAAADTAPAYLGVARSALGRRWVERAADASVALAMAQRLGVNEVVGRLLVSRGVTVDGAAGFLNPAL
jgi:single-stranded-DNA-specific exonuclease